MPLNFILPFMYNLFAKYIYSVKMTIKSTNSILTSMSYYIHNHKFQCINLITSVAKVMSFTIVAITWKTVPSSVFCISGINLIISVAISP